MEWTNNMELTPNSLNELQTRAYELPVVMFDMEKGFYGQEVIEAINAGKLVLIMNKSFSDVLSKILQDSYDQKYQIYTVENINPFRAQFGSKVWSQQASSSQ